ncbi:MAG: efflux RND transporter periplasmic adaptor subunit [Methylococcales bacterium]|nr:efflux RND transporter periplasmic adaptor subunit [Methylococcales bacterium]
MKNILRILLLIHLTKAMAVDMQIKIDQQQIDMLAIDVAPLSVSRQVPELYAPAKVVAPANHDWLISSSQPGLLVQLHANIGDSIVKGQLLATINSPELVSLQRDFLTAGNELGLSELEYRRDKTLQDQGVITDRRWQQTQTIYKDKQAQLDTARQLLAIAGMSPAEIGALAKSRKLGSLLHIYAPISGVVLARMATVGARLDMQAPLYRIADLSELWLEINIPQERLNLVHIGDLVKVENTSATAGITLLGQSVNPDNQTVLARAVINGRQATLKVGQNVNVQIIQSGNTDYFRVLNTAIAQNGEHSYIFVRNAAGFQVTEVKIIGRQDTEAIISAPLTGQEQIAETGSVSLKAIWLKLGED